MSHFVLVTLYDILIERRYLLYQMIQLKFSHLLDIVGLHNHTLFNPRLALAL
jgi:hypothetical protein